MKKTGIVAMLLIVILLLPACGCKHEWVAQTCETAKKCSLCGETEGQAQGHQWLEANCEAPKTCAACGITQGQALNHNWQEATCETPKSCTVCGVREGEALPHTFCKWTIEGQQMRRSCEVCSFVEETAVDREKYFMGNVAGHWDTDSVILENIRYNAYALENSIGVYLRIGENSIFYYDGMRSYEGSCVFTNYEEMEKVQVYRFRADFEGVSPLNMAYCESEQETTIVFGAGETTFVLARYPEYTQAMAGSWGKMRDNQMLSLQLNEDRTFRGELDGSITGTWHVRPVMEEFGSRYMEIILSSPERGPQNNIRFRRSIYGEGTDLTQLLKVDENTSINSVFNIYNRVNYSLNPMDPEDVQRQKSQLDSGMKALLGTWVSREHTVSARDGSYSRTSAMVGYEFTFLEDSTFRAVINQEELTGIWSFIDRPGDYTRYRLDFDNGDERHWSIDLYDDGRMIISCYGETENIHYNFIEKEEQVYRESDHVLVGTWYPGVYKTYDTQTRKDSSETIQDDFIILNEDGTLTGRILLESCTGIWSFEGTTVIDENTDHPSNMNTYKLIINGKQDPYRINHYERDGSFHLTFYNYDNEKSYNSELLKENGKEQQEFINSGMERILGEWRSTEWMESGDVGEEIIAQTTDAYSVSVYPDGSFVYNYHNRGSGTWFYDGYDAESNQLTYTFQYNEEVPFSYRYSLNKEDVLFGWYETENTRIGYYFERVK